MRNSLETRIGIFVALTALAAVFILEMVGGPRFARGYHLEALFNNAGELKIGDRVKMAGVEVGRVEAIELADNENKVRVRLKVRRDSGVKTDSIATIKFTGLGGQNFVSLDFGSRTAPPVTDNTILGTTEQPDLNTIMTKLDNVASGVQNLTKSFTGETLDNLFGPLINVLQDNREPLHTTLANLSAISTQIASRNGSVGKLIYDQSLYDSAVSTVTNLQTAANEIKVTVADARKMLDQVNAGQGSVGKMIKDDRLYNETLAMIINLREVSQKVNTGQGSIGKLVNDQEMMRNIKMTLQKLDKATEGLEDQGPLSVLGIVVNNLF
jgi:phospholipid/cholesterol/gamma-HCH transport system substrate-binding protein